MFSMWLVVQGQQVSNERLSLGPRNSYAFRETKVIAIAGVKRRQHIGFWTDPMTGTVSMFSQGEMIRSAAVHTQNSGTFAILVIGTHNRG